MSTDYRDTVFLPRTEFPMKADLPKREPDLAARWDGMGGYGAMGEGVTVDGQGTVFAGEVGPVQGLTKFTPRRRR